MTKKISEKKGEGVQSGAPIKNQSFNTNCVVCPSMKAGKTLEIECEGNKLGSNMKWRRFKKQGLPMAEQITEGRVRKLLVRNATCQDGGFYIAQEEDTDIKCQIQTQLGVPHSEIQVEID